MRKYLCILTAAVLLATPLVALPVAPAEAASVTVDTTNDVADGDTSSIANLITYPGTDGFISLREAIEAANNTPGTDSIEFTIDHTADPGCDAGTGVCTIQPLDVLPALTDNGTTIDGYTQGDAAPASGSTPAKLRVVLDGSIAPGTANGLIVSGSGDHLIKGLAIHSFPQNGIYIHGTLATNVTVEGCYIGTDHLGATALPNTLDGVHITLSANVNYIGGVTAAARNVISGNGGSGVDINTSADENMVMGNYIGTDASGSLALGNAGSGVLIQSGAFANLVGGATPGAGNVISSNSGDGILLTDAATNDNQVEGNLIGLAVNGASDLGNGGNGIEITLGANNNSIGGATAVTRNVISGNDESGIQIWSTGSDFNTVTGNYIGTEISGTLSVPNALHGIRITISASSNTVGGTNPGQRNLISGNTLSGISIESNFNTVLGNFIGTDVTGGASVPNNVGVTVNNGGNNLIGGASSGSGNLISGNGSTGVMITGASATANEVFGNDIGINAAGDAALGNGAYGVFIVGGAHTNSIGSGTLGSGNRIVGNNYGVYISGSGTDLNTVAGNIIGADASGTFSLPNGQGVVIKSGAKTNTIGGDASGEGNLISGNSSDGVRIYDPGTDGNVVCGNTIGLNMTGSAALANSGEGVEINQGPDLNVIGGSPPGCLNVISGNQSDGVRITGTSTSGNVVANNLIGLDATGMFDIGNLNHGVSISAAAANNIVGGETAGSRNVISGNDKYGVLITGNGSDSNRVIGNYIGTDLTGLSGVGNQYGGLRVFLGPQNTEIGGDSPGERNVIAGNSNMGVLIEGLNTTGTVVSGNYIGTDMTGTVSLLNSTVGIYLLDGPDLSVIGGDLPGERNIISGNGALGVALSGADTSSNTVKGNYIGSDTSGAGPLANGSYGVWVSDNASGNTIGPSNLIAFNGDDGVYVENASQITITQNSIHSNASAGIDLIGAANGGLPAPTITQTSVGSLLVEGIGAPPDGTVEVFANPDTDGEGKTYLGSTTADVSGIWFLSVGCMGDPYLTATATDLAGNTSEFSPTFISLVTCLYLPLIMR